MNYLLECRECYKVTRVDRWDIDDREVICPECKARQQPPPAQCLALLIDEKGFELRLPYRINFPPPPFIDVPSQASRFGCIYLKFGVKSFDRETSTAIYRQLL